MKVDSQTSYYLLRFFVFPLYLIIKYAQITVLLMCFFFCESYFHTLRKKIILDRLSKVKLYMRTLQPSICDLLICGRFIRECAVFSFKHFCRAKIHERFELSNLRFLSQVWVFCVKSECLVFKIHKRWERSNLSIRFGIKNWVGIGNSML